LMRRSKGNCPAWYSSISLGINLHAQGRLKIAGPLPAIDQENPGEAGFIGSLLVVDFESRADLQIWLDADPYRAAGVYTHVDIYPFKPVLP